MPCETEGSLEPTALACSNDTAAEAAAGFHLSEEATVQAALNGGVTLVEFDDDFATLNVPPPAPPANPAKKRTRRQATDLFTAPQRQKLINAKHALLDRNNKHDRAWKIECMFTLFGKRMMDLMVELETCAASTKASLPEDFQRLLTAKEDLVKRFIAWKERDAERAASAIAPMQQ
jgi:hypothetical protein